MTGPSSAIAPSALLDPPLPPTRTTLTGLWLLTVAAGCADALCFLVLGKVFASFMSGNFLFLGIGAGTGDWTLTGRAALSLGCFFVGAVVGTVVAGRTPRTGRPSHYNLMLEIPVLLVAGLVYLLVPEPGAAGTSAVIIALFATGMGLQAATALDLNIPGVLTNALTATWVVLARSIGKGVNRAPAPLIGGRRYLVAQCAGYGVAALAVASVTHSRWAGLAPVLVVSAVLGLVLYERKRAERAS